MSKHVEITSLADYAGPVLVDFWAEWCHPCKMQNPVLEDLVTEQGNIKVAKIDVDKVPELSSQNQVFAIPTMMFMSAKDEAGARNTVRQSGFLPMHELLKWMGSGGFVPAAKGAQSPSDTTNLPLAA
jgi:thioredoxin